MRNSRVVCMVGCPRGPPHVCLKGPRMWWVENLTLSDSSTKSSSRHSSDRATPTGHEDAGVGGGRQEPVDGLGPRRVQENQARRLYSSVPGGLTSTAPVFCIPPDPFPRGDNGLRAGHQVEPGDECCLDFEEPVVPAESTSIREGDGGGPAQWNVRGDRGRLPPMPGWRTAVRDTRPLLITTSGRGEEHTLSADISFSPRLPRMELYVATMATR